MRVALTAAALAAAACTATTGDPTSAVTGAPDAARAQATYRFESMSRTESADGAFEVRVQGSADLANEWSESLVTIGEDRCRLLRDRTFLYATVPGDLREDHDEKAWTESVRSAADPLANEVVVLDRLREASDAPQVGDGAVRGTRTTRYRATVPTADLVSATLLPDGVATGELEPTLAVDAWIDTAGLPWRLVWEWELGPVTHLTTVEYFDHGEPVEVEFPAEEDTDEVDGSEEAVAVCLA